VTVSGSTGDGTLNESLNAFDATTGATLWSAPSGTFGNETLHQLDYSPPVMANGVVYVGSSDGSVYAFGLLHNPVSLRAPRPIYLQTGHLDRVQLTT
jgi:outer membrane protein assembly factor BamB